MGGPPSHPCLGKFLYRCLTAAYLFQFISENSTPNNIFLEINQVYGYYLLRSAWKGPPEGVDIIYTHTNSVRDYEYE